MALPVYYIQTIKLEFDRQTAGCIWAIQKICFTSKQFVNVEHACLDHC